MTRLYSMLHDMEGKILVWISLIYGILSVVAEVFKIDKLQTLYHDPKFFVPALSFFLFLMSRYILSLNKHLNKIEENNDKLVSIKEDVLFLRSKNEENEIDRYWNSCLIKAEKGIYQLTAKDGISVDKNHSQRFWRQFIVKPNSTWFCTDIVKPDEKWGYGWNQDTALGFQTYAIEEGVQVKRIFIITDENLLSKNKEKLYKMMLAHEKVGVNVRWITENDLSNWISLDKFKNNLKTIDFAIADKKYIMSFILDENLIHKKFMLKKDEILANELHTLYETLWLSCNSIFELHEEG